MAAPGGTDSIPAVAVVSAPFPAISRPRVPDKSRANKGKEFEAEIKRFFEMVRARHSNLNNIGQSACPVCKSNLPRPKRKGDLEATYLDESTGLGVSVLVECKETADPRIALSRVEDHQIKALERMERSGGIALVCVKWTRGKRAWAFPYRDLAALGPGAIELELARAYELEKRTVRVVTMVGEPNDPVWDLRPRLAAEIQFRRDGV